MINKIKLYIPLILFFAIVELVQGQQDAQYTQYMFNTLSVNPAYAGSRGQLSISGLYRSQWVGLDGAPTTQTFNVHSPIRNSRLGYGLRLGMVLFKKRIWMQWCPTP